MYIYFHVIYLTLQHTKELHLLLMTLLISSNKIFYGAFTLNSFQQMISYEYNIFIENSMLSMFVYKIPRGFYPGPE